MKIQIHILIFSLSYGCSEQSEKSSLSNVNQNQIEITPKSGSSENIYRIQTLKELSNVEKSDTYEMTKQKIEVQRTQLKSSNIQIDSIGKLFEESLLNKIIPFWEGTEWSFEGHSSKPKSGRIACGYFVSTTLQDIGLNLNRYRLAQQSPINEAKSLALDTEVKEISETTTTGNISSIKEYLKEGIHFIGFDESHVGYVIKQNDNLYLIHSNYINAIGVEIEQIEKSEVFNSYNKYHVVELSTNEEILKHWINGEQIEIVKK